MASHMPRPTSRTVRGKLLDHPVPPSYSGADEWGRMDPWLTALLPVPPGPSNSGTAHGPPAGPARERRNDVPGRLSSPAAPDGVPGGGPRAIESLPQTANLAVTA